MTIRPKQLARIGVFYLHEAILDVLCEHYPKGHGLGAADIGRMTGIYRGVRMNDAIVSGCLNELEVLGKVEPAPQENTRGGWRLSEKEYGRRGDGSPG